MCVCICVYIYKHTYTYNVYQDDKGLILYNRGTINLVVLYYMIPQGLSIFACSSSFLILIDSEVRKLMT